MKTNAEVWVKFSVNQQNGYGSYLSLHKRSSFIKSESLTRKFFDMAFIAFEGGEGTGKSTQMKLTAEWLRAKHYTCLESREPGGSPLAEKIRALFKEVPEHGDSPTPLTELMLVMAARAQHFEKIITPALHANQWIVCDRFLDSSYVYQGLIGGLPKQTIDDVAKIVIGEFCPDLTLVFTVPEAIASARRNARGSVSSDRMDQMKSDVHSKIDDGFQSLVTEAQPYPHGKVPVRKLIEGSGTIDEIFKKVKMAIEPFLDK